MNRFQFLAVCLSLRSKHLLEKRGGAAALFCSFVGVALQNDHTEHAQKATANNKSPQVTPNFFVPENFLWRLAPMHASLVSLYIGDRYVTA